MTAIIFMIRLIPESKYILSWRIIYFNCNICRNIDKKFSYVKKEKKSRKIFQLFKLGFY